MDSMTKDLVYRFKPSGSQIALLKELESLKAIEDPAPEQLERMDEIGKELKPTVDYRFTFGRCNALQMAKFNSYIRKSRRWFEEESGMTASDFFEDAEQGSDEYIDMVTVLNMGHAWAASLSALTKFETREVSLLDTVDAGEWQKSPIPDEWKTVEGFLSAVPIDLLWAMEAAANDVNPSLWHTPMDDVSKKFGVLSAS